MIPAPPLTRGVANRQPRHASFSLLNLVLLSVAMQNRHEIISKQESYRRLDSPTRLNSLACIAFRKLDQSLSDYGTRQFSK